MAQSPSNGPPADETALSAGNDADANGDTFGADPNGNDEGSEETLAADGVAPSTHDASEEENSKKNEFVLRKSTTVQGDQGVNPSKIKPTQTEAAMKFVVIDKDKGPIVGVVVSLTAPDGSKYYTQETDAKGYAEVLVPVGQKYELVYLSLGRQDIAATVPVSSEPNQNIRLTLRYKRHEPIAAQPTGIALQGVNFDTGKASIRPESFSQLDRVVEYMQHKKSARIRISGHTDNVGDPQTNKRLSEKRAQACRDYLIAAGIDGGRIEAVGYGDEQPVAPNTTPDGRQKNRRIEATEL